ncbi:hypothetical protein PINS_up015551 [Pythium insidiosum]|nr:hypothetical protein PINS_up015551 [Pythium insidiosum]
MELKTQVKAREKELISKFKQSNVSVPKKEVEERAKLDIIDDDAARERKQAESEWLKAELDFLHALDDEEERRMLEENAEERIRREKGALKVQSAFRMFAARRRLKGEIRRLYVKEFDPTLELPRYRNTYTGETFMWKPFGLGPDEDLEYPDQWFIIDDTIIGACTDRCDE